ncbi:hypothetical protein B0T20DRAFT_401507 [Sordaria brevicollis]|uniref:C2H2-type domain-containing protein n=1 Tax=Sordaria brevicollis TaxID=83679 RepID=A0AAE0PJW5_SORBR|nr:hypothetical protein B0T20DRAFT_401507 [Sordaria brevicollis]
MIPIWQDPSDDHDNHNKHAGDAIHAGPLAEDSIVISGQPLVHPTPAVGGSSSSPTRSKSSEVLTSAPADVAVSHAAIPKLFTCDHCDSISAKTPRDFNRHLATKKHRKNATKAGNNQVALEDLQPSASGTVFRCPVASCGQAYSRKDNLWRHIAAMHDI